MRSVWAAVTAVCATRVATALPRDVSTEGHRIDDAMSVAHLLIGACSAVGVFALLYIVLRFRRGPARFTRGTSRREVLVPLLCAAFVLVVVDGYLLVKSTMDLRTLGDWQKAASAKNSVHVEINARQWAWDTVQPGSDGRFATDDDIYQSGELTVPVGRKVAIQLGAIDVVHALYIPNLRIKIDAIPGRIGKVWFQATEAGDFEIACSQHCGVSHYRMRAVLHVLPPDQYDAWLAAASVDAERMESARRELDEELARGQGPPLFPEFGKDPAVRPRGWAWSWAEGLR